MEDFNVDMIESNEIKNDSQSKYLLEYMKHNSFKLDDYVSTIINQSLLDQIWFNFPSNQPLAGCIGAYWPNYHKSIHYAFKHAIMFQFLVMMFVIIVSLPNDKVHY